MSKQMTVEQLGMWVNVKSRTVLDLRRACEALGLSPEGERADLLSRINTRLETRSKTAAVILPDPPKQTAAATKEPTTRTSAAKAKNPLAGLSREELVAVLVAMVGGETEQEGGEPELEEPVDTDKARGELMGELEPPERPTGRSAKRPRRPEPEKEESEDEEVGVRLRLEELTNEVSCLKQRCVVPQITRKGVWGLVLIGASWILIMLVLLTGVVFLNFLSFFTLPVGVGLIVWNMWSFLSGKVAEEESEERGREEQGDSEEEEEPVRRHVKPTPLRRSAKNRR